MLAESNSGISSTSNSAFHSLLTGREGLILGDGNQVSLQHNSIEHDKRTVGRSECDPDCSAKAENQPPPENNPSEPDQVTEGCREPDAAHSFDTNWECQGARPKHTQMQRPMDPPLWPISSPVSDGLAKDFLARHSRDRALQGSLYTDDKDLENNETVVDDMQGTSIESCNQESSSSCWSGPRASLVLVESNSGISFTSNSAFHSAFTGRNHSLNREQHVSRECDSPLNQNFLIGQLISPNPYLVYGSNSSNFTAGIVPRYLIDFVQSSFLFANQRSHHSNLNLESQSSQFGDREQAEASFSANGIVLGMLAFIVPSL